MKVAVIGSEGGLGKALCRALAERHEVRRVDVGCPNEPGCVRGDVRGQEDMERAVQGMDVVVHLAAYHGGYFPPPTDETRFEVNVTGTFRVLQACLKHGIQRVVWASSMAAVSRGDIYSITKVLGEDLCDYYFQRHGFQIATMRFGSFTPCDLLFYGQRLLTRGVDRRDCVAATARAVDLLASGQPLFSCYTVMPEHPFTAEEHREFGDRYREILERLDPAYPGLVERYRIEVPKSLRQNDLTATHRDLEFAPAFHFGTFLAELKARDAAGEVTPDSPRYHFEQGMPPPEGVVWPRQQS